ncbi:MAG: aldo/keto reductase [Fimbriimonadaceae bacterium]|nr:aldo/keto reductase [Fimbriimonadaceae bacterium]
MRYRTFPGTDLTVSEIGFGVWTLTTGWWPESQSGAAAVTLLREALDLGVTLFDTADVYGDGLGETILRDAFGDRREQVVIASKGGYDLYNHPGSGAQRERPQDFTPAFLRFAVEQSLQRLGTDYLDFYQLHNVKMEHILADDTFAELEALRQEGKLRWYGTALGPAIGWVVEGVAAIRRQRGCGMQMIYNLLEQEPGATLYPAARRWGHGFLIRVPHSSGLLEGHYTAETTFPPGDHRRHRPRSWLLNGLQKVAQLEFLTRGGELTLGQAALLYVLAEPLAMSCLPNIYDAAQLRELAAASDQPALTPAELAAVATLYANSFGIDEAPLRFKGIEPESAAGQAELHYLDAVPAV